MQRILALAAAFLLLAASCSSPKRMMEYADPTSTRAVQEQYGAAIQNAFIFSRLQAKVKLSMGGQNLSGRLNIEQGKRFRLIINAPLLGFEVGRIEVDRDSLTIVNKIDKTYAVQSLAQIPIDGRQHLEPDLLACLFLGRVYVPGRGEARVGDYKRLLWSRQDDGDIRGDYDGQTLTLSYRINPRGQVHQLRIDTGDRLHVLCDYGQYERVADGIAPTQISLSAPVPPAASSRPLDAQVTLSNINPNADRWDPFDPEDKYTRLEPRELLAAIQKLLKK